MNVHRAGFESKFFLRVSARRCLALIACLGSAMGGIAWAKGASLPRETAKLTFAPEVPPPLSRVGNAVVVVRLRASTKVMELAPQVQYRFWTFNDHVPAPFIRAKQGDLLEVHISNADPSGMPHNLDFHAVEGPGGGGPPTTVVAGEEKVATFRLSHPGLFLYHCGTPPVMDHIANGMYGLILVEPKHGLPKADREFYVLQSEFYASQPAENSQLAEYSHEQGLAEKPSYIVFNGRVGALQDENSLHAKTGERIRIYFGDAGPNKVSSFHIVGGVFDKLYREGDLLSPPARSVSTTLVPAGGAAVVELSPEVPGDYTLLDHAIFRMELGAIGNLRVEGHPRPDLYNPPAPAGSGSH